MSRICQHFIGISLTGVFKNFTRGCMRNRKIILALSFAILGSLPLIQSTHAENTPRHIEVTAKRFGFEPAEITLKKGEPVDLILKSTDTSHGLRFRELNVDVKVGKGGTNEVRFTPNQTGTFVGHCSVFCGSGHGSMKLTLHVVD
jgi:cytochrome c oxidase subunit 2